MFLHQVTLVGLVRSVKETSTRVDYEIDDGTAAPIEVKQFIDNDVIKNYSPQNIKSTVKLLLFDLVLLKCSIF